MFIILDSAGQPKEIPEKSVVQSEHYVGVGIFVNPFLAVTAAHNFTAEERKGSDVEVWWPQNKESGTLKLEEKNDEHDYAILRSNKANSYVPLYAGNPEELVGQEFALCAYQFKLDKDMSSYGFTPGQMGVMQAIGAKLSEHEHYILYQSSSWSGDSGGALIVYDGQLAGIHLAMINDLDDSIGQKMTCEERLTDVEASVKAIIGSMSSGCVGLLSTTFAQHISGSRKSVLKAGIHQLFLFKACIH